jgi:phosphatidylserine/phosphatidylglycerophosphate/cardiolipin synthase-like enzyme
MSDNSTIVTTVLSLLLITSYIFLIFTKTSYEALDCMNYAKERLVKSGNRVEGVFFVPDDPVKKILLGLIYHEKKCIKAAVYQLTDPELLKALIDAHKRGVKVEVITDKSCLNSKYEKITKLKKHGIKVWVYEKHYSIMHNKFWVFGKNGLGNKPLLLNGSANPTKHGTTMNEENVQVIDRIDVIKLYNAKFDRLKQKIILMAMPKRQQLKFPQNRNIRFLYGVISVVKRNGIIK